jgi:hypothetical protein
LPLSLVSRQTLLLLGRFIAFRRNGEGIGNLSQLIGWHQIGLS